MVKKVPVHDMEFDELMDIKASRMESGYARSLLVSWFCAFLGALVIIIASYLLIVSWTSTGPNCPGIDPEWIGHCEEGG